MQLTPPNMKDIEGVTAIVETKRSGLQYDEERGCYVYDIAFKTRAPLTDRSVRVAEAVILVVYAVDKAPSPSGPITSTI